MTHDTYTHSYISVIFWHTIHLLLTYFLSTHFTFGLPQDADTSNFQCNALVTRHTLNTGLPTGLNFNHLTITINYSHKINLIKLVLKNMFSSKIFIFVSQRTVFPRRRIRYLSSRHALHTEVCGYIRGHQHVWTPSAGRHHGAHDWP